jgi:hypothetical protein
MRSYVSHFSKWKIPTHRRERLLTPAMDDDCRRLSATIACTIFEIAKISFEGAWALQPSTKLWRRASR